MFEKEADEWVKENMDCCETDNSVNQSIPYFSEEERCIAKSAFKDGAEFGYNKANEWHCNGIPHDNKLYLCKVEQPTKHTPEEIKNRLSNIGEAIGTISLEYIAELEKGSEQLKAQIEQMKSCGNCNHFDRTYELCQYSLGDEDYNCRNRKWELAE